VTFLVQGQEIKAHRVVAASQGGVLRERLKTEAKRIEICEDVTVNTFNAVLQ
jgi:hypothetical protein